MENKRPLADNIKRWYGGNSPNAGLTELFNGLSLPLPGKDEYFKATPPVLGNPVYLTFMNDTATVLRVTHQSDYHKLRHNHVIQPLFTKIKDGVRLDILPGLTCPVSDKTAFEVADALKKDGITFYDPKGRNVGALPDGFPVVIDFDAVSAMTFSRETIKRIFGRRSRQNRPAERQDRFFAPLKKAFSAAWPEGQDKPDPEKINAAWALCRTFKRKGVLKDSWNAPEVKSFYSDIPESKYRGPQIPQSAAAYQRHRRHNPKNI